ncbi:VOC family protein [Actinopolymorpha sp. B9G3]|uniref:VOC family protein n=1 Tax=Actinopolymorpha sp. B9G3 TaxID=3158970 RepID=UPI0032D8D11D
MKPATVIVSLPAMDLDRSLRFYRDGLGLSPSEIDKTMILFELPNLSLFLIVQSEFATYASRAGVALDRVPAPGGCIISCAIGSKGELDDILARAGASGGTVSGTASEYDGSYMGYFADPDGHLWELVFNAQTEVAATGSDSSVD